MLVPPAEVLLVVIALILLHLCLLPAQLDPIILPEHVRFFFSILIIFTLFPPPGVSGFCIFPPLAVLDYSANH